MPNRFPAVPLLAALLFVSIEAAGRPVPDAAAPVRYEPPAVRFSPDGVHLAAAGARVRGKRRDGVVTLWSAERFGPARALALPGRNYTVSALAFSPDGRTLATGSVKPIGPSVDNRVELWDPFTGRLRAELPERPGYILSMEFSRDGRMLGAACASETTVLWPFAGSEAGPARHVTMDELSTSALSPDGQLLATGNTPGQVEVLDLRTQATRWKLPALIAPLTCLEFSPDGSLLAGGCDDPGEGPVRVRLWDAATGRERRTLLGHRRGVRCLAFSPDGKRLATGSTDRTVRLWNANSGACLRILSLPSLPVSLDFSASGSVLAVATQDGEIRLFSLPEGKPLRMLAMTGGTSTPAAPLPAGPHSAPPIPPVRRNQKR